MSIPLLGEEKLATETKLATTTFLVSSQLIKKCYWIVFLVCGLTLVFPILAACSIFSSWDDSFMFGRYAENFINYKALSWNPGGAPTYGLTSLGLLTVVVPLRLVLGYHPGLITVLQSLLCGLALLGVLAYLILKHLDASRLVRYGVLLIATVGLALNSSTLAIHFNNGFDTAFDMLYLTSYILLWKRFERKSTVFNLILLGVWGGLAFWIRPDTALFTFGAPAALLVLGRNWRERKQGGVLLVLSGLLLGSTLLANYFYFKMALPLPFYAKTSNLYGIELHYEYSRQQGAYFLNFLQSNFLFFLLILLNLVLNFRNFWQKTTPGEKGFLAAIGLTLLYYLIYVLPIMGMNERYNQVTLPALVFLACVSTVQLFQAIQGRFEQNQFSKQSGILALIFLLLIQFFITPTFFNSLKTFQTAIENRTFLNFQIMDFYEKQELGKWWAKLAEVTTLPDDLVIAVPDTGLVGIMAKNKQLVDTAGLNSPEFIKNPYPIEVLINDYKPDLIYVNTGYKDVTNIYRTDSRVLQKYDYHAGNKFSSYAYDVLVRKDSPHYNELNTIFFGFYSSEEVLPRRELVQKFTARSDNLWRVIIPLSSSKTATENCLLSVKVVEVASNRNLAELSRPCKGPLNQEMHFLSFEPIPDSKGKDYEVIFTSSGAEAGKAPKVNKLAVQANYPLAELTKGGELQAGGLDLRVEYDLMKLYQKLLLASVFGLLVLGGTVFGFFQLLRRKTAQQQAMEN